METKELWYWRGTSEPPLLRGDVISRQTRQPLHFHTLVTLDSMLRLCDSLPQLLPPCCG